MKAIITFIVLAAIVVFAILSVKWALDRSKSNKTSLFGNMNGEYREDNLGKMGVAGVQGLEDAAKEEEGKGKRELTQAKDVVMHLLTKKTPEVRLRAFL
ncbi:MAG: hypothetical protein IJI74_02060 [Firmicutes bacterium]|nr:hypothetical protein [Bacillota bacterium]